MASAEDTLHEIEALDARIKKADAQSAKASAQKEAAEEQLAALNAQLKDFGVETWNEAKAKLIELEKAAEDALATAREKIEETIG